VKVEMDTKEYVLSFCTHVKAKSLEEAQVYGRAIERRFSNMFFLDAKLNPEQQITVGDKQ